MAVEHLVGIFPIEKAGSKTIHYPGEVLSAKDIPCVGIGFDRVLEWEWDLIGCWNGI